MSEGGAPGEALGSWDTRDRFHFRPGLGGDAPGEDDLPFFPAADQAPEPEGMPAGDGG